MKSRLLSRIIPLTLVVWAQVASAASLSLDEYLAQVEGSSPDVKAAREASEGAALRAEEASLIYSPQLSATASFTKDKRQSPFLTFDHLKNNLFDVNVSQLTNFGLEGKLGYSLIQTGYVGLGRPIYYYGSPNLELSFDLWRNWLGSETKARESVNDAATLAARYQNSYAAKAARAEAETAYVQLASARAIAQVYSNSLERAKEIYNWNSRRFKLNLGEDSDLFQAEANLEATKLALQASQDQARVAARAFNRARGIDSDTVEETVMLPNPANVRIPVRTEMRDDVRAAREQSRVAAAQATLGAESTKPKLQVFGTYALNSQEVEHNDAISHSFRSDAPTRTVGVRLTTSLSFGKASDIRSGYGKERVAAEVSADQKVFNQEIEWKNLVNSLNEAKARLAIAEKLSAIQQKKAVNERKRLSRGRTTTYQNLIFETDYNNAESSRIQAQSEVLQILARMRTFGG